MQHTWTVDGLEWPAGCLYYWKKKEKPCPPCIPSRAYVGSYLPKPRDMRESNSSTEVALAYEVESLNKPMWDQLAS
jgi:hypothetical protein